MARLISLWSPESVTGRRLAPSRQTAPASTYSCVVEAEYTWRRPSRTVSTGPEDTGTFLASAGAARPRAAIANTDFMADE